MSTLQLPKRSLTVNNRLPAMLTGFGLAINGVIRLRSSQPQDQRSLVIIHRPKEPHYQIAYRLHQAGHDAYGKHISVVIWTIFYVLANEQVYVQEAIAPVDDPMPTLSKRQFRQLRNAAQDSTPPKDVRVASGQEIERLQRDLLSWRKIT